MSRQNIIFTNSQRTCEITCNEELTYDPYIPEIRTSIKKSNKAIFIQNELPKVIHGDTFEIKAMTISKEHAYCLYRLSLIHI